MTAVSSQRSVVSKNIGAKSMPKSILFWLLATFFLTGGSSVIAQQLPAKSFRIGYLTGAGASPSPALLKELRELGYIEGQNMTIEFRSGDGKPERRAELAAELVRLKVNIIVADGAGPSLDAKKATSTIPIVMMSSTDPVALGLVASLARPGGNVTGLASQTRELGGKLLELLKESVPRLSTVAMVSTGSDANTLFLKETEPAARALGLKLIHQVARRPEEIESAFAAIKKQPVNGLLSRLGPSFVAAQHKRFVELAVKHRLPAISNDRDWVDSGGLLFYGADQTARLRRVAVYVDKILKGTKPADLPVEQPMKFEFIINLKAAKQIGLTIPPNVLVRADRVIK
jgi:putative ABC transport system substrate-binding protein